MLALVVALGIQIGTNYVNDYADGVRGTDEHRVGPIRLVAGKLASVREVKIAALIAFGVAGLAGLGAGGACHLVVHPARHRVRRCGMGLHGRPPPLRVPWLRRALRLHLLRARGHGGLGVRPARSLHHLAGRATSSPMTTTGGSCSGRACPWDCWPRPSSRPTTCATSRRTPRAGKKTLAVRLGRQWAGLLYCFTLNGGRRSPSAFCTTTGPGRSWRCWPLPLAIAPVRLALGERGRRASLPMLGTTARLQIVTGALLTVGLLL